MDGAQALIFTTLAVALGLFVWGRWRYDLVALGTLLVVVLAGLVETEAAFSGFAHPAVITVAAVLVVSKGLQNGGIVDLIAETLSKVGRGQAFQILLLSGVTACCSAFMNNVGALALLMPVAIWLARQGNYSPSAILMPLAFASLLGGMTTMIGTPPNLIIASVSTQGGGTQLGMFSFLPVGLAVTVVGLIAMAVAGPWLIPQRVRVASEATETIRDYLTEVLVPDSSPAVGCTVHEVERLLGDNDAVSVVRIIRDRQPRIASDYDVLRTEDVLVIEGKPAELDKLIEKAQLSLAESKETEQSNGSLSDMELAEVVIPKNSPLVGRTAASMNLRQKYKINLLAVSRHGAALRSRLGQVRFALGDILLFQGEREGLTAAIRELGGLALESGELRFGRPKHRWTAVTLFALGLAATVSGLLPVQISLAASAVLMILWRVVDLDEAYEAIDWPIIVLLAAMMPVGQAFESTGSAQLVASQIGRLAQWGGPTTVLPAMMIVTMLLSNVINNAAAAVLMAPIALRLASNLEYSTDALLMSVCVGASTAFLTPIGHQSNTLVMQPGGYRFGDYWPLGLVVSLAVVAVATPLIQWLW